MIQKNFSLLWSSQCLLCVQIIRNYFALYNPTLVFFYFMLKLFCFVFAVQISYSCFALCPEWVFNLYLSLLLNLFHNIYFVSCKASFYNELQFSFQSKGTLAWENKEMHINNDDISTGFEWKYFFFHTDRLIYKRRGEELASLVANASREPIRALWPWISLEAMGLVPSLRIENWKLTEDWYCFKFSPWHTVS